jgi:hypothetical protein
MIFSVTTSLKEANIILLEHSVDETVFHLRRALEMAQQDKCGDCSLSTQPTSMAAMPTMHKKDGRQIKESTTVSS